MNRAAQTILKTLPSVGSIFNSVMQFLNCLYSYLLSPYQKRKFHNNIVIIGNVRGRTVHALSTSDPPHSVKFKKNPS